MRAAIMLPFSPRRSYGTLQRNSIGIALGVVVVFATLYSTVRLLVSLEHGFEGSWLVIPYGLAVFLFLTLLEFAFFVVVSTLLMKGRAASRREFLINANAISYWFAWRCVISSILMSAFTSHAIAGENIVYVITNLVVLLWFLFLFVSAISVANSTPVRNCWIPGFLTLLLSSIIMVAFGFAF